MNKVEEIARAIALADLDGETNYYELALAAIKALRTPSRKMLDAAAAAMSEGKRPTPNRVSVRAKHGIRYRAMIDVLLEE